MWSLYNIAVGTNDFIPDSLVFDVPGTSLNNITHVGIYVLAVEASGSVLELQNLQVNATPIPEPNVLMAYSLLAIGIVGRVLRAGRFKVIFELRPMQGFKRII